MVRWAAAAAALALVLAAAPAGAHQNDPTIVTRIDSVTPADPKVLVEVRSGVADQLFVVNATGWPFTVLAAGGEPFLRIGAHSVEANVASPDWYTSNSPFGTARVPATASAKAEPDWRVVSKGHSWGWFDHRLHNTARPLTPELRRSRTPVRLTGWSVPFRHKGTTGAIIGHVEYRPLLGAFRSSVEHRPPDTEVDVLDGRVPGLFLRWRGPGTLLVRGIEGEPFARLTPQGVEVNDASPTWQDDQRLRGAPEPATPADPRGTPRWRKTGTAPSLTWLDRRLAYAPGFPPEDVARDPHPTTLVEWDVPVEVAGTTEHLRGTTTWQPNDTESTNGDAKRLAIAAGVAVAAAVGGGLLALRRRAAR